MYHGEEGRKAYQNPNWESVEIERLKRRQIKLIDMLRGALSKLESQVRRNPELPPSYAILVKDGYELIRGVDNGRINDNE
jgi:hypothetical protein